jgi:tRNA threonylcarbamoyladenosine biosynthesis protein TsaE
MQTWRTHLPDESATADLGVALGQALQRGTVVFLHGDLGAGKTALTRALIQSAGHAGPVRSPTYTLSEPYRVTLGGEAVQVVHFDLYRMSSPEEFLDAGFREDFNGDNVCIVEWPEKAGGVLPPPDLAVFLSVNGQGRDVELQALSSQGQLCLERLTTAHQT